MAKAKAKTKTKEKSRSKPAKRVDTAPKEVAGAKLPKALRVKVRQRFTLERPGFEPLTVKRTRRVLVRRARR